MEEQSKSSAAVTGGKEVSYHVLQSLHNSLTLLELISIPVDGLEVFRLHVEVEERGGK